MSASHSTARSTVVEGVGDEILLGATCFVASIIFLAYFFWRSRNLSQTAGGVVIHPQSESLVRDVQAELNRQGNERRPRQSPQEQCPICLGEASYCIETNCGHIYCGICVLTYWQQGNWMGAMKCAVCRQQVTLLLANFSEEDQRANTATKDQVVSQIGHYNRRFSGEPVPLMDYIRDLPTLLSHLIREFFSVSGLILMFRLRILVCFLLALIYFVSPLDIVPEAAFGILGFLDDFVILLLLAIYVTIMYRYHVGQRS